MKRFEKLYEAAVLVKTGASVGSAASRAADIWRRIAYEVAPPVVMAAPAATVRTASRIRSYTWSTAARGPAPAAM